MKIITALRVVLMMLWAAACFLLPMAIALPLSEPWRRKVMFYPWFVFAHGLRFIFGASVTVEGKQFTGGKYENGHLFICNHLSVADIPLLVSVFPLPFVAKRETMKVPIIGQAGWLSGNIVFDRSNPTARKYALKETLRRIKEVNSIYIFPEGTRSRNGIPKMDPYMAMIWAAWDQNIDVVPMAIHGSQRVLRVWHADVSIKVGEPLKCADYPNREQFARACWHRVIDMYYELNAVAKIKEPVPAEIQVSSFESVANGLNEVLESVKTDLPEEHPASE